MFIASTTLEKGKNKRIICSYLASAITKVLHDLLGSGLLGDAQHDQCPPDLLNQLRVGVTRQWGEGGQTSLK